MSHLGDIVEHSNRAKDWWNPTLHSREWKVASSAIDKLHYNNIPHGISAGNHDYDSKVKYAFFDRAFPIEKYVDYDWYAGSSDGKSIVNSYQMLDSGEGRRIVFIHIGWANIHGDEEKRWLKNVINMNANSYVVLVSHVAGSDCSDTVTAHIAEILKAHCNVKVVLGGHVFGCGGEKATPFKNACNETSWVLISDFQARKRGGSGWLRIYTISSDEATLSVNTYSPMLDSFEMDNNSFFSVSSSKATLLPGNAVEKCSTCFVPPVYVMLVSIINSFSFATLLFLSKGMY